MTNTTSAVEETYEVLNATMYREAGARRGVHFNPECPHSVFTTVERGQKSEPKSKATSTRKCMLENYIVVSGI